MYPVLEFLPRENGRVLFQLGSKLSTMYLDPGKKHKLTLATLNQILTITQNPCGILIVIHPMAEMRGMSNNGGSAAAMVNIVNENEKTMNQIK